MRSRAVRLTLSAMAVGVLAAAAFFVFQTEQQIEHQRADAMRFEERIRAVDRALADLRMGLQAYVAAGQSADTWIPKVTGMSAEAARGVDDLRAVAATADARASLMEAAATITDLAQVDRRIVDYLKSGQDVMAADMVYSEAGQKVAQAANQVDAARALEGQGVDVAERISRRRQLYALGAAAAVGALTLLLLGAAPASHPRVEVEAKKVEAVAPLDDELSFKVRSEPRHSTPIMKVASEICTDLARVNESADLEKLLGRAADLMDASGLVVWMGNSVGGDLRPVAAHGYSAQTIAKMPAVPKNANNAAAAAYRTGALQIVLARPGTSSGALVAPLLTPDGCIGALSAEIKGRGETSDSTQSLSILFAAQLASVLGPVPAVEVRTPRRRPRRSLPLSNQPLHRRANRAGLPRRTPLRRRLDLRGHGRRLLVAHDPQGYFAIGRSGPQLADQVARRRDAAAVDRRDHVTRLDPGSRSRRIGNDRRDEHAISCAKVCGQLRRQLLHGDAEPRARCGIGELERDARAEVFDLTAHPIHVDADPGMAAGSGRDGELGPFSVSHHCRPDRAARRRLANEAGELPQAPNPLAVELDDHVLGSQAGSSGRAVGRHGLEKDTPRDLELFEFRRLELPGGDADARTGAFENGELLEPVAVASLTANRRGGREEHGGGRNDAGDHKNRSHLLHACLPIEASRSNQTGEPGEKLVR